MGLSDIFGGGDQETTSEPWGPQQKHLKNVFKGAESLYGQGPSQFYPGSTFADVNPALQDYMSGMGGYYQQGLDAAGGMMEQGRQLQGGLDQAQQFMSSAAGEYFNPYASAKYNQIIGDSVANNPVLQSQIEQGQSDINRNLQENILPSIASGAVGTGNTGSTRRGVAEGIAMRGAMEQGSDLATSLQSNAYNQALNQAGQWAGGEQFGQGYQMNAADTLANLGQYGIGVQQGGYGMGADAYQDLLGTGMLERGFDQEQIAADRERWDFEQNAPWENLQRYQQAVSGNYGGTTTQEGAGLGNQLLQMGTQLGGAYLMSDPRLKENIRKVGEIDGLNVYEWDWNEQGKALAGNQPTRGFMYDEMPSNRKIMTLSGYGMVDYSDYEGVVR